MWNFSWLAPLGPRLTKLLAQGVRVHQNRASPFASDFYRRRGYRRELRSEDHFYPFSSQKRSRFASDFLRRGNRASWGLKKARDFFGERSKSPPQPQRIARFWCTQQGVPGTVVLICSELALLRCLCQVSLAMSGWRRCSHGRIPQCLQRALDVALHPSSAPWRLSGMFRKNRFAGNFRIENTGPIFMHPHPPTPASTLLGVGGV